MDEFFALPAFKPAEALVQLKRQLRELRPLVERGDGFDYHGRRVVELEATDTAIEARLARRPALTPEWRAHTLKASPDLRRFVEAVKRELAGWSDE
jgi:hypothetical protein